MNFGMFIFNLNHKNWRYLNPPLFPQKMLNTKTRIFQGAITREVINFLMKTFLVTLQIPPFQKFILVQIFYTGWRRGQSTMFNLRKIDLKFVFCYISPCNFFSKNAYNSSIIHRKSKLKKIVGLYHLRTHLEIKLK